MDATDLILEELKELKNDVKSILAWKNELSGKIKGIVATLSLFFTALGFFISLLFK